MRGQRERKGIEAPESQLFSESTAETAPAVNVLTWPWGLSRQCHDPALPPGQPATSFIQHVSPVAAVRVT